MSQEIINLVRDAGVVGAGGAGFPTHVKISARAEYVIINGAECEPLLRVDQQLMAVEADKVVRGLEAVMTATGAPTGIIALKAKYKDAYTALEKAASGKPIKLFKLGDFFPAGDEQVMVFEVLGRVVPEGGIPLKVGCVVSNVETMLNVSNALTGTPVTEAYLTITGEIEHPVTVRVPIGTPISELLEIYGIKNLSRIAVIDGGPMMGRVLDDLSQPVTKASKGFIVLPRDHQLVTNKTLSLQQIIRRSKSACIQCAMCTEVCPRALLGHSLAPHKIMRGLNYLQPDEDVMKSALLCCECGVCELYGCPMQLSPRQVNSILKKQLSGQGIKLNPGPENVTASPVRDYRKIPSKRLVARLGLTPYDKAAPMLKEAYVPEKVCIPLRQHIGAPAQPVVSVGQKVEKGDLIAVIPEGALGANIHASINGTVKLIRDCIEIESDGERGVKY